MTFSKMLKYIRSCSHYRKFKLKIRKERKICQKCGSNKLLQIHHIRKFAYILRDFRKQKRIHSKIQYRELIRAVKKYKPFWDENNMELLCSECHKIEHKKPKDA